MKLYKLSQQDIYASQYGDPLMIHLTNKILTLIGDKKGKLLDVGCGGGRTAVRAALRGFEVWGVDTEEKAISIAKDQALRAGVFPRCKFIVGNILDVPEIRKDKFDVVVCSEVLEHIREPEKILIKIRKLLKPNGVAVITVPHDNKQWTVLDDYGQHLRRYNIDELAALLDSSGDWIIERVLTVGWPFMRSVMWIYNKILKKTKLKHGEHLKRRLVFGYLYRNVLGYLLKVDDLFNWLNWGTTIVLRARKSDSVNSLRI